MYPNDVKDEVRQFFTYPYDDVVLDYYGSGDWCLYSVYMYRDIDSDQSYQSAQALLSEAGEAQIAILPSQLNSAADWEVRTQQQYNFSNDISLLITDPINTASSSILDTSNYSVELIYAPRPCEDTPQIYNGANFQEWLFTACVLIFFVSLMAWRYIFRPGKEIADN